MQPSVILVDGLVYVLIHLRVHRARQAVGYRGDKMSAGAAGIEGLARKGEDLLGGGVRSVDSGAHAAHEDELALELRLKRGNVVLRQRALPDLNAYLRHVLDDGDKIGVGVVDGDAAARADIAVESAIRLLEKFAPHFGLHEHRVFRAPVVMRENDVGLQIIYEQLHIAEAVLGYVLYKLVHLVGVLVKRGKGVFKIHEEVALLENARAHKAGKQLIIACLLARLFAALLPALRAACGKVGRVHDLPPARYVRADRKLRRMHRNGSRRILGKAYRRSPSVNAHAAAPAVAAQKRVYRIVQAHMQRLVLLELPLGLAVGLQKLEKYFLCSLHYSSLLIVKHARGIGHRERTVIIFKSRLQANIADPKSERLH